MDEIHYSIRLLRNIMTSCVVINPSTPGDSGGQSDWILKSLVAYLPYFNNIDFKKKSEIWML